MPIQASHSSYSHSPGWNVETVFDSSAAYPTDFFGLNTDCLTSDKLAPSAVERLTCCCLQQKEKKHCQMSDSKYLPRKCKSDFKVFEGVSGVSSNFIS